MMNLLPDYILNAKSIKFNRETKRVRIDGRFEGICNHDMSQSSGIFAETGHNVGSLALAAELPSCRKIGKDTIEYYKGGRVKPNELSSLDSGQKGEI